MKQRFQILNDPRFHLVYGVTQRFSYGPSPKLVRLNREGFTLVPGLKRKTPVYPGMLLGEHPAPDKGDLFASIHGEISEITERSVFLAATDPSKDAPEVEPVDLLGQGLEGDELALAVKKMGVNTRSLGRRCKTLIINALNPDPGVTWAEPMLVSHVENLRTGMELHRRMARADNVILAVPKGSKVAYEGIPLAYVEPEYPNSVDQLVIKAVTGEENPEGVGIVGLHNIWSLGRVGRLGRPLIETVVTIGSYEHSGNYIVRDGSTIGELLQFANIRLHGGARRAVAGREPRPARPQRHQRDLRHFRSRGRNHPTDGRAQPLRKLRGVRAGLSGAAQAEQPQPIRGVRSARTLPCRAHRILSGVRPLRVCLHRPAPRPPVHPPRQAQACGDGAGQGTGRTEDEATLGRKSQKDGSAF